MEKSNVETLYEWIDETTNKIQQYVNEPYLESLGYTMEIVFMQEVPDNIDESLAIKLQQALVELKIDSFSAEEVRKANQLAILKGMKGSTQQQHLMTPETVSLMIAYLANKLFDDAENIRLFDPAGGTGNLITAVLSQLPQIKEAFASEVDSTLIQLAVWNANLQKKNIEFFHQDSLRPFLLDPVDLIVADLPVGYYPDDLRASDFKLKADKGHSYAHHLFIEQSLNYTKPGGYLILVIPEFLFDSDQSDKLQQFIHDYAHMVGILRLPESAFKSDKHRKSILILQKKGQQTASPKQPLLVKMPSFNNTRAMGDILGQINNWFQTYKKELNSNE
ncbi:MAG: class I SAM-dependent methyltransferase [Bacillota bacterium]|uniref:Class I SAM-dependent methyltransferase n=1 Tax=Virgibacillus salarius TaxID=447199 RepID=A0A941DUW2_9BACI|nr:MULTISPECIES: class I SAM-dependent methyltransferase [Bacillaceae]MBR7795836.1 class I SAM-dependent methyltransferase [Virgibacillus salarius]MDY7044281.1 class I SAM-dependent methyltransferase [Virgibacillus sp. M23]NAZ08548.1 N-6 DNA methylase [Agaribacter marinus]WBX78911.1 class I SAM-dependent methyltransferase [Virgibacillus salarius]